MLDERGDLPSADCRQQKENEASAERSRLAARHAMTSSKDPSIRQCTNDARRDRFGCLWMRDSFVTLSAALFFPLPVIRGLPGEGEKTLRRWMGRVQCYSCKSISCAAFIFHRRIVR
jgi:hypothetical protein